MINKTLIQYFEWYVSGHQVFWKKCKARASRLAEFGITDVWLPPAYKAGFMEDNVGYAAYDLYDLGEFNQKGMIPTKYGTKEEYLEAIEAFHENGIEVIADIVMNHKMGADAFEEVNARCVNPRNRMEYQSDSIKISAPTVFNFPGRNDKYSSFKWNHNHFTGVDWDNDSKSTNKIYQFSHKKWANDVNHELGNYDFLMGADVDVCNLEVKEELFRWGKWYMELTKIDGFRLDAVKHMSASFIKEWVTQMRKMSGKNILAIGEYWHGDIHELSSYLAQIDYSISIFDVPLHYRMRDMSYADGNYDMRKIFENSVLKCYPNHAITFVDNHDSQPGQALESFVNSWMKQIAYALILLHKDGIPCVFYGDLYGIPATRNIPIPRIRTMIKVRHDYAYGKQHDYLDDYHIIGWTREGSQEHPYSGLALLVSNEHPGTKRMYIGKHFAGKMFRDCMRKIRQEVVIDSEGYGNFTVQGVSAAIWVVEEAYEALVIHED